MKRNTRTKFVGALVGLAMVISACGSDTAATSGTTSETTGETTVETTPGTAPEATAVATTDASVDTAAPSSGAPQRIVSLSPTATEMVFAIGAGDLLVAVDEFSNYPAAALDLPHELSGFEPNVEAIAAYEPDLVLTGGDFTGLADQLAAIDIPTWDGPAAVTIDDVYAQIEQLGEATGHGDEATELVTSMQTRIDEIVAAAPVTETPLTYFHELDNTLYTADSTTFIGALYSMLGLVNVADQAEGDNFGYPQLNAEYLITANPDLIFLADTKCCAETAATVAARDGWDVIAAVQNGNIVEMDDDIASRWGPRIVDYLEAVDAAVAKATASS